MRQDTTEGTIAEDILRRYFAAMNAGHAEQALALFADDAVRLDTATPNRAIIGKAQIERGVRARINDQIQIMASDYQSDGNSARCMATVYTNYGRRGGFAPVNEIAEIIVEAGKIQRFTITVLAESLERIQAAEQQ